MTAAVREGRLARDGAVSFVGAGVGAAAGLVLSAVVGRQLGTSGAGLFFQAVGVFTIATNVLKLGADTGLIRFLSSERALDRRRDLLRTVAVATVPVALVGIVGAYVLQRHAGALAGFGASPETSVDGAADLLRSLAPYLAVSSFLAVLLGATRGLGRIGPYVAVTNLVLPLGRVALVLAVSVVGASVASVSDVLTVWAAPLPVLAVVAAGFLARGLRRERGDDDTGAPPPRPVGSLAREFWGFSSARGVAAALEITLEWADVLILAAFRSPAEAGIYAVASRSVRAGQIVEQAVRVALSPRVSALLAVGDTRAASALFLVVTRAIVLLAWPFYLTLIVHGEVVLGVFGPGFVDGAVVLAILSATMMVMLAAGTVQTILLMGGRSSWQMANKAVALSVGVAGSLTLVPRIGMLGSAAAWSASVLIDVALASWQVRRRLGIDYQIRSLGLAVVVPLVTFGAGGVAVRTVIGPGAGALALGVVLCGGLHLVACWRLRGSLGLDVLLPARWRGRAEP